MRSVLFSLGLTFAVTLPCQAQEAKSNTLTPKEIADGWILLFDGETTFGWQVAGEATVADGALHLGGKKDSTIWFSVPFSAFKLEYDYEYTVSPKDGGARSLLRGERNHDRTPLDPGKFHAQEEVEIVGRGRDQHRIYVRRPAGLLGSNTTTNGPSYDQNTPGFQVDKGAVLTLRNIKLMPTHQTAVFNGKDLTGWKVFPGDKYKSKFTVTDKGELNVKDGPGDLQTAGKYQNFILQLECISNGKHLNSGIFFRCQGNEYQNGYEAQIRNQFTAEATQDYVIEEVDPKTNKLVEKKKIKSTAVDYGTGAIYRRQPARKEMAKDGEWFSMTIIANGNHIATWVNGVQVTDWTDNRPVGDNARTGQKLDAGHISIQGHDPTTNLSFRNLRIAELPGTK